MSDQIGVTANAGQWGIPAATVAWAGTAGSHSLTVFTDFDKKVMADLDPTSDSSGERLGHNRRNKRVQLSFSAHPKGSNEAAAQAIAADLPYPGQIVTITAASDPQAASSGSDTILVDDASGKWTPEGELVVSFTVTKWIGKVFVALS